jgi:large conductance mechanosensitive channel protein
MLRVPRSRGALSGVMLVLLGVWGALIPFIGPYFHYAYTPSHAWVSTPGRFWLEIIPGAAAALGGLILLGSANRAVAAFGAWLAALAGGWFVVGPALSTVWASSGFPQIGVPVGGTLLRAAEQIGFFAGLGAAIIFFGALALGRMAVVGARDAELAAAPAQGAPLAAATAPDGRLAAATAPDGRLAAATAPDGRLAAATAPDGRRAAAGAAGTEAAHRRKETSMLRGFKNFLMQGDLVVIAVGLVVALAFSVLIKAFTDNIITPLVNAAGGGGAAGQGLGWTINGQRINLGAFISAVIYFIIFVAVIYFLIVVPYRAYMRRRGTTVFGEPEPTKACPECKAADLPIDATRCKYCATPLAVAA